jgi:AraC family transcriptional regulator, regulatory protein of adaptative response / methylated-DNA-[protein]-cysteine methyltransferase
MIRSILILFLKKRLYFGSIKSSPMKPFIHPIAKKEIQNRPLYYSFAESPFARLCLASTEQGICWVSLIMGAASETHTLESLKNKFPSARLTESFQPEHAEFMKLFEKKPAALNFHLLGTPFQLEAWKALLNIPLGETTTYGALATQIGRPKAFRAVGSAVGANPIFYAIPCHRVLPASGGVGNYYWGTEIKKAMLDWEKSI